jgi:hypothetical protein
MLVGLNYSIFDAGMKLYISERSRSDIVGDSRWWRWRKWKVLTFFVVIDDIQFMRIYFVFSCYLLDTDRVSNENRYNCNICLLIFPFL